MGPSHKILVTAKQSVAISSLIIWKLLIVLKAVFQSNSLSFLIFSIFLSPSFNSIVFPNAEFTMSV